MIVSVPASDGAGLRLCLKPNRALSGRGVVMAFVAMGSTCLAVALWSAVQGNVFAPFFAALDIVLVGVALRLVWRSGERAEWIELSDDALTVRREAFGRSVEAARFHPYWVRLGPAPQGHPRVILSSHGRSLEVGAFLGETEREALAATLRTALGQMKH
ncbi:MAG TPA: DUF2244 domain-containing protein [Patescibacteria group bacterium]|nr:DUF2244 domain-containing protein [Patescibacteria group bacterium]